MTSVALITCVLLTACDRSSRSYADADRPIASRAIAASSRATHYQPYGNGYYDRHGHHIELMPLYRSDGGDGFGFSAARMSGSQMFFGISGSISF